MESISVALGLKHGVVVCDSTFLACCRDVFEFWFKPKLILKRIVFVDLVCLDDDDLTEEERTFLSNFKKTFINAKITEETGDKWLFNEGCLSIPGVREDVSRQKQITIEFLDEQFTPQRLTLNGLAARVVQHEYDHIEGILFTDKLSSFKKQLIKGKLTNISKGKVKVDYRMKFYKN